MTISAERELTTKVSFSRFNNCFKCFMTHSPDSSDTLTTKLNSNLVQNDEHLPNLRRHILSVDCRRFCT